MHLDNSAPIYYNYKFDKIGQLKKRILNHLDRFVRLVSLKSFQRLLDIAW